MVFFKEYYFFLSAAEIAEVFYTSCSHFADSFYTLQLRPGRPEYIVCRRKMIGQNFRMYMADIRNLA